MKTMPIVAALAACTATAFAADIAPSADGSFTSRTFTMPVSTAMAFRGQSILDKSEVIIVALTNGDIRVDWFAAFFDRRRAIERRMKDKETAVVYLEFKPDGAYRGLSYYFAKGNNCGYCGGGARRDVDREARQRTARGFAQVEGRAPDIRRGVQSPGHAR